MSEIATKPRKHLATKKVPFGAIVLARKIIRKTRVQQTYKKFPLDEALKTTLSRPGMQNNLAPNDQLRQHKMIELITQATQDERKIMTKCIISTYDEYIHHKGDGSVPITIGIPNKLTDEFIDLCNTSLQL